MSIEPQIKEQFSKIFDKLDWAPFKLMADYYFENAAKILKKDINIREPFKLMERNIQKRLFIGIGTELILKSVFLKNEYCINRVKEKETPKFKKPTKFSSIKDLKTLNPSDTFNLGVLIDNISEVINAENLKELKKGLNIAKVFRNKEGHVAVLFHKPDSLNYTDIENSIMQIYNKGFNENLEFQIAFENGEKAKFIIK